VQSGDLNRMRLLLVSVEETLQGVSRLADSVRRGRINCAFADVRRAQYMVTEGRVDLDPSTRVALAEVSSRLASAAKCHSAVDRAELVNIALTRAQAALRDINNLAQRQEEVMA